MRREWPPLAAGGLLIAIGVAGLVGDSALTRPGQSLRYVVGAALVHDLVVAPIILAVGAALRRLVPPVARWPVVAASIVSATVVLVAWPALRGYGRLPNNPSLLPRHYARGVVLVLATAWVVAAVMIAVRLRRHRGNGNGDVPHADG